MKEWTYNFIAAVIFSLVICLTLAEESCEEIEDNLYPYNNDFYYLWNNWNYYELWHNMSFWGGHLQIPWKDQLDSKCYTSWGNLVVLTEKHPDIETIEEDTVTVQACSLNQNGICEWYMEVQMRKCNGDLFYTYPWVDTTDTDTWNHYVCFDRIYAGSDCYFLGEIHLKHECQFATKWNDLVLFTNHKHKIYKAFYSCEDTTMGYFAGTESDNMIHFSRGDIKDGWYDAFYGKKQFVFPSLEDRKEKDFDVCTLHEWGLFLPEPMPSVIDETPTRLAVCYANYDLNEIYDDDNGNCHYFIYVRECNGKLQFDLSVFIYWFPFCLIHHNHVKVKPEIGHNVQSLPKDGKAVRSFIPFLQYRCDFERVDGEPYRANWYINGTFQVQMGPSSSTDDLVFKEDYLNDINSGYEVQCGIISVSENESVELLSDPFFAGWKAADNTVSLRKSGHLFVDIEQTIPLGCHYREDEEPNCVENLILVVSGYVPEECKGGIKVQNANQASKSYIVIQSLRKDEEWNSTTHSFKLTTIDNDYDDKTDYDLQVYVTHNAGQEIREVVPAIHVDITEANIHWNKRCYSHVDPHMKTADGKHYELQREGDHTMYLNNISQILIQTSARYCRPGFTRGPVCACGIAIAVGADVFVINKCPDSDFKFDFVQCGDGGIIDIERIQDNRYRVRTPIGTIIDIFLHEWSDTMNIDIYMSAKDFRNVFGLCGYFDGDPSNDLRNRDGTVSDDNNRSYKFSDSWRLTDEENMFKHGKSMKFERWNVNNGGMADPSCSRSNSITRKKCKVNTRHKRAIPDHEVRKQYQPLRTRKMRSAGIFTEEEAFKYCNHSIYTTSAVLKFLDKLAEEDPDIVVEQCMYDLIQGNDTKWADAHITVLNNAADTILKLNPVYTANNIDIVNSFRLETCLTTHNCSGNGVCEDSGLCYCSGVFRGAYCDIDIRIPPLVYAVEGNGICQIEAGDDCTCFQIRTDNIFEGFMCDINMNKVYFNGTRVQEYSSIHAGDYIDVFTGECCAPEDRQKRSDADNSTDDIDRQFVAMYQFAVSNDGVNYGETSDVYVYDTTCLQHFEINGNVTIELKDGYCFIDATCVVNKAKVLATAECYFCDPATDPYSFTKGHCEESSTELTTGALISIIIGSVLAVIVASVLVYLLYCKISKKHRTVVDVRSNLRFSQARETLTKQPNYDTKCRDIFMTQTGNQDTCIYDSVEPPYMYVEQLD